MEALLEILAHGVGSMLELIAIVIVAIGALQAVADLARIRGDAPNALQRRGWLKFAHWLVVALTFQLAADIVATTLHPSWTELGKLATIAGVRTFLTYFLDRDVEKATELERRSSGLAA
ncbi:MAG: DUF1622 domain-containing protein [Kofleriaceae bacterium]|nr:DUF1622 domain-containing protein [Kofleriaceae bacterium]